MKKHKKPEGKVSNTLSPKHLRYYYRNGELRKEVCVCDTGVNHTTPREK